jgi:hypothetical protein
MEDTKTIHVVHKGHTDGKFRNHPVPCDAIGAGAARRIYEQLNEYSVTNAVRAAELFMQHRRSYWVHPVTGTYRRVFHHNRIKQNRNMSALDALRKK